MVYDVIWHDRVLKDLKSLDDKATGAIVEKIKTKLARNPLALGKSLKGIFKGLYRFPHADYRIIYALDREEKKIIVLHVVHRKETCRR